MARTARDTEAHKGRRLDARADATKVMAAKADSTMAFSLTAGALGLGITLFEKEIAAAASKMTDWSFADHQQHETSFEQGQGNPDTDAGQISSAGDGPEVTATAAVSAGATAAAGVGDDPQPGAEDVASETVTGEAVADAARSAADLVHGEETVEAVQTITAVAAEAAAEADGGVKPADFLEGADLSGALANVLPAAGEIVSGLTDPLLGEDGIVSDVLHDAGDIISGLTDPLLGKDGIVPDLLEGAGNILSGVTDPLLGDDGIVPGVLEGAGNILSGIADPLLGEDGIVPGVLEDTGNVVSGVTDPLLGEGGIVAETGVLVRNVVNGAGDMLTGVISGVGSGLLSAGNLFGGSQQLTTEDAPAAPGVDLAGTSSDSPSQPSATEADTASSQPSGSGMDMFEVGLLAMTSSIIGAVTPIVKYMGQSYVEDPDHPDTDPNGSHNLV